MLGLGISRKPISQGDANNLRERIVQEFSQQLMSENQIMMMNWV